MVTLRGPSGYRLFDIAKVLSEEAAKIARLIRDGGGLVVDGLRYLRSKGCPAEVVLEECFNLLLEFIN